MMSSAAGMSYGPPQAPLRKASMTARILVAVFGPLLALGCGALAFLFILMAAFGSDSCGASSTCNTEDIGTVITAVWVALGAIAFVALATSIIFAIRPFWGWAPQTAVLVACALLAIAACVGGFYGIDAAIDTR